MSVAHYVIAFKVDRTASKVNDSTVKVLGELTLAGINANSLPP